MDGGKWFVLSLGFLIAVGALWLRRSPYSRTLHRAGSESCTDWRSAMIPEYPTLPASVVMKLGNMGVVQICHQGCAPHAHYHLMQTHEDLTLALIQLKMEGYNVPIDAC